MEHFVKLQQSLDALFGTGSQNTYQKILILFYHVKLVELEQFLIKEKYFVL